MASFQLSFQDFPWVYFIHNDSGNGSLETSVHPEQFLEYAKTGGATAAYGPATHICHCLPGLMNIFIPNVSLPPQSWTSNFVIKSILLSTGAIENIINLQAHRWPPLEDPLGVYLNLGLCYRRHHWSNTQQGDNEKH